MHAHRGPVSDPLHTIVGLLHNTAKFFLLEKTTVTHPLVDSHVLKSTGLLLIG